MAGNYSRSKGKRAEAEAKLLLQERDYDVEDLTDGQACADFMAIRHKKVYRVEVKNHAKLDFAGFRRQAKAQAGKARWMLLCRVPDHPGTFYVEASDIPPTVWRRK